MGGAKCLIIGEKHYFVWDTASQSTKWLYVPKSWGGHGPFGLPGYAYTDTLAISANFLWV